MNLLYADTERMNIDQLRAHCHKLEAQLQAQAEHASHEEFDNVCRILRLTASEARLLVTLLDGRVHSKEHLLTAMYAERPDDEPEMKIIDVFICKIRRKVRGAGFDIRTHWGNGYSLADTQPLRDVMAGFEPDWTEVPDARVPKRPVGSISRAKGVVRDAAIKFLIENEEGGVVELLSKELSTAIDTSTAGAAIIRNLETVGYIEVLTPARGRNNTWKIRVTDKGRELVA